MASKNNQIPYFGKMADYAAKCVERGLYAEFTLTTIIDELLEVKSKAEETAKRAKEFSDAVFFEKTEAEAEALEGIIEEAEAEAEIVARKIEDYKKAARLELIGKRVTTTEKIEDTVSGMVQTTLERKIIRYSENSVFSALRLIDEVGNLTSKNEKDRRDAVKRIMNDTGVTTETVRDKQVDLFGSQLKLAAGLEIDKADPEALREAKENFKMLRKLFRGYVAGLRQGKAPIIDKESIAEKEVGIAYGVSKTGKEVITGIEIMNYAHVTPKCQVSKTLANFLAARQERIEKEKAEAEKTEKEAKKALPKPKTEKEAEKAKAGSTVPSSEIVNK